MQDKIIVQTVLKMRPYSVKCTILTLSLKFNHKPFYLINLYHATSILHFKVVLQHKLFFLLTV